MWHLGYNGSKSTSVMESNKQPIHMPHCEDYAIKVFDLKEMLYKFSLFVAMKYEFTDSFRGKGSLKGS